MADEVQANYRFTVAYDGREFFGWQRNRDKPTIQGALESAITEVLGARVAVHGSGRTDRGAHALGQVASFGLGQSLTEPLDAITAKLNTALPEAIEIRDLSQVPLDFHARESAIAKQYLYLIWTAAKLPLEREAKVWHAREPLDADAMAVASSVFVGEHDFASFAKKPNFKGQTTVKTVSHCSVRREGELIRIEIRADSFLYKMVRNMVRALAKVGEGRWDRARLSEALAAHDRKAAPGTAPASGLYLERVFYPGEPERERDASG